MASKRRLRAKKCGDKKRYSSREQAWQDRFPHRLELQPYCCQFCHRWHLGHPNRAARIARAAKARQRRAQA